MEYEVRKGRNEIVALIIGRGNNTMKDKNILPVLGKPLLQWGGLAAKKSDFIGRYYISSDCDKILKAGVEIGFNPIIRPNYLSTATSQSSDVVRHALSIIENDGFTKTLVVIHANVGTISAALIDQCITMLNADNRLSSVIPSHRKDEYHPLRGMKINSEGTLIPFVESRGLVSANRQDLEICLFFDHSFWVLDVEKGIKSSDGVGPWPVMGKTILPFITEGCFDVHEPEDIIRTEKWIIENILLKETS